MSPLDRDFSRSWQHPTSACDPERASFLRVLRKGLGRNFRALFL